MEKKRTNPHHIQQLGYQPPDEYQLDLEVFSVAELRQRVDAGHFRTAHRIAFYLLICVTQGKCTHIVDFKPVNCEAGTLLALCPAQANHFDADSDWDGWLLIFRPEFLLPLRKDGKVSDMKLAVDLEALPEVLRLTSQEFKTVTAAMTQMHGDASLHAPSEDLHALLRHQLYALLLRLQILRGQREALVGRNASSFIRFKRFQQLVEKNFAKCHQVSEYARIMGCSEKSLTRAALEAAGMPAKMFIAARINLEAKRLLAHTAMPIGLISDYVGFDEETNFTKFFKREVGCSPGEFRRRHASGL
jgi:AraC-like DNA-binding protein